MSTRRVKLPEDRLFRINLNSYDQLSSSEDVGDVGVPSQPERTAENEYLLLKPLPEEPDVSISKLPDYDYGKGIKTFCIVGLVMVWIVIIVCIVLGTLCVVNGHSYTSMYWTSLSIGGGEAVSLAVNALVTLCLEALGYIHGTSLRWALFREDHLEFNTNIRLFKSARKSPQNGWPSNAISTISLILCYAASSQLFIYGSVVLPTRRPNGQPYTVSGIFVNGTALLALSLGLLCQAIICTWIMLSSSNKIITWSSNALNNTLAAIHHGLTPRPGRCMLSVHQTTQPSLPTAPLRKQQSALKANRLLTPLLCITWILPVLALAYFLTLMFVTKNKYNGYYNTPTTKPWHFTISWNEILGPSGGSGPPLNMLTIHQRPPPSLSPTTVFILAILLLFSIQGLQTLTLHTTELLTSLSRDESLWQRATSSKGTTLRQSAFASAVSSPQVLILFVAKTGMHWLMGQMVSVSFRYLDDDGDSQLFFLNWYLGYVRAGAYLLGAIIVGAFVTVLCVWRRSGGQPGTWGHLQTIADLVDYWGEGDGEEGERLWWGDKGWDEGGGVRHAGVSGRREGVGELRLNCLYS